MKTKTNVTIQNARRKRTSLSAEEGRTSAGAQTPGEDPHQTTPTTLFTLGEITVDQLAFDGLHHGDLWTALDRFASGDWGQNPRDAEHNDHILQQILVRGGELRARFVDRSGQPFGVVTTFQVPRTSVYFVPEDF